MKCTIVKSKPRSLSVQYWYIFVLKLMWIIVYRVIFFMQIFPTNRTFILTFLLTLSLLLQLLLSREVDAFNEVAVMNAFSFSKLQCEDTVIEVTFIWNRKRFLIRNDFYFSNKIIQQIHILRPEFFFYW